jgi:hypothetical protein
MKKKKNPRTTTGYFIFALCCLFPCMALGQITAVQYWFDNDFSGRSSVGITSAQSVQIGELNTAALTPGIHQLHIRAKDDDRWSVVHSQVFYKLPVNAEINSMADYEYWLDSDFDNRTTGVLSGNASGIIPEFDLNNSPEGIHVLHIRAGDSRGNYSPVHSQVFYKLPVNDASNSMVDYEYWLDNGFDNRTTGTLPGGASGMIPEFDYNNVPEGIHVIYFRAKDSRGYWSGVHAQAFYVNSTASEGEVKIAAYRYWYDDRFEDSSLTALTQAVNPFEWEEKLTLPAGFNEGEEHAFHIQFQNTAGNWSVATTDSFKIVPIEQTGIADVRTFAGIRLYPNPVSDGFFVSGIHETATLRLMNLSGNVILSKPVNDGEYLPVSSLAAGIYIVRLQTGDGTSEQKLIKR